MLIAPIFKVDYLTKQPEAQNNKIKDIVPQNVQNKNSETSSSTYNIFKTAINRGTELIRSTFLSKNSNFRTDSNGTSSVYQSSSINLAHSDTEERSSSSSSESSSSDGSSPDSIKKELMLFKPIAREPRTVASTTKILQIPSIRSTSSNSAIQTPCPSPFFIPITSQRQSAFSFVRAHSTTENDNKKNMIIKKPKSVKRKNSCSENKKSEGSSPPKRKTSERKKADDWKDTEIIDSRKTRGKTEKQKIETRGIKTRQQSNILMTKSTQKGQKTKSKAAFNENISKKKSNETNIEYRRVTRSMKN